MKKEGYRRKTIFEKKKVMSGFTQVVQVARVMGQPARSTGFCTGWSFNKSRPVQPPGQPDFESTRQTRPSLISAGISQRN